MQNEAPRKDVSIGEFDAVTGLTLITRQRGRLLLSMGRAGPPRPAPSPAVTPTVPTPSVVRVFRSGVHTGRTLFPEEACYLLTRDALVLYEMEEVDASVGAAADGGNEDPRRPLTLVAFIALVQTRGLIPLPCVDVYNFLKGPCKLHPRRHDPLRAPSVVSAVAARPAFDVFKTVTETVYEVLKDGGDDDGRSTDTAADVPRSAPASTSTTFTSVRPARGRFKKRKIKRPRLIYRVAICRFTEAVPSLVLMRTMLRSTSTWEPTNASDGGMAQEAAIPLKLAVADVDQSVLLFDVA